MRVLTLLRRLHRIFLAADYVVSSAARWAARLTECQKAAGAAGRCPFQRRLLLLLRLRAAK